MIQFILFYVNCCFVIFGVTEEKITQKTNSWEIPFLERFQQHDYNISFERGELDRYDKNYMKFVHIVTFKYNRTTPLVNATYIFKIDVGNNLQTIVQAYRFASNEYRMFPMRFQLNFCEAYKKNIMGLGDMGNCGTYIGCPMVKEKVYKICNWTPNPAMFPPFVPSGQYMIEILMVVGTAELYVMRGYATIFRPIPILD